MIFKAVFIITIAFYQSASSSEVEKSFHENEIVPDVLDAAPNEKLSVQKLFVPEFIASV